MIGVMHLVSMSCVLWIDLSFFPVGILAILLVLVLLWHLLLLSVLIDFYFR